MVVSLEQGEVKKIKGTYTPNLPFLQEEPQPQAHLNLEVTHFLEGGISIGHEALPPAAP